MSKLVKVVIGMVITSSIGMNGVLLVQKSNLLSNVKGLSVENKELKATIKSNDYEIKKLYELSIIGDYEVLSTKDKNWIECENIGTGQKLSLNKMYTPNWLKEGSKFYYNINEEVLPCAN